MAVQAQYPSNVLLLNRSVQEGKNKDYSLQIQPGIAGGGGGGGFIDQSHMIFNGGGTNPRKRSREVAGMAAQINSLMSMQLQSQTSSPQLIDLSQLHSPQTNVVSTGLRLAFGDQQQQRTLSPLSSQQQSSVLLSLFSQDLATQIKQQGDEIEHFIQAQGEHLRRTLADKRQRHYRALIGAAEQSMARRLTEKETAVEKAARHNAELEARAAQLSAEAQAWQARAREQEATAATLQAQLHQAMIGGGAQQQQQQQQQQDREGGGLGCCAGEAEDAESAYIDPDRVAASNGPCCKACGKRVASVVLLPCRHLCVCTECDAVLQACPLCFSFRSSSVEVFFC